MGLTILRCDSQNFSTHESYVDEGKLSITLSALLEVGFHWPLYARRWMNTFSVDIGS